MTAWFRSTLAALLLMLLAALAGCGRRSAHGPARATVPRPATGPWLVPAVAPGSGTRAMAERLETLARTIPPENNIFDSDGRVGLFRARLAGNVDTKTFLDLEPKLSLELLNSGRPAEAIVELTKLRTFVDESHLEISREHRSFLRWNLAVAELRLGETENCLTRHSAQSCLLPIKGSGVHSIQRGSRAALALLREQLEEYPDDLEARWLFNIAAMTVGDYPDKVPPAWLIPPKIFASEGGAPRFTDVAGRLGLDVDNNAGGAIVDDFDDDGYLDVMISSSVMHGPMHFFHNNADGTFADRTREAGLAGEIGGLNMVTADYNNDGFLDVLVLRGAWLGKGGHHPNSLLRNNGDGTFEDVTEAAGLLSLHPTQTAVWFDYNGDGWIDLYIGNETRDDDPQPCELYRNNGDGTFTDIAAGEGLAFVGMIKAVVSDDFNNDGRPDLYISDLRGPNHLIRNDGPRPGQSGPGAAWSFTEVGVAAGVTEPLHSFPAWFFDYDNDGWPDLFVSSYGIKNVGDIAADLLGLPTPADHARLFHNNHDGTFCDVTREAGLYRVLHTMGCNFGDIDNDGWLDFYLGTGDPSLATIIPNRMFRNIEGRLFKDVTTAAGVGHLQKGHGVSFADIDNDGDQDIFEEMGGAVTGDHFRNVLYENPGSGNHWVTLRLEGVRSNRAAIGARIQVAFDTAAGPRSVYRTVGSGGSFGASPLRQEIGLGQARAIREVTITWPASGTTQVLKGLALDRIYAVREGDSAAREVALKRLSF